MNSLRMLQQRVLITQLPDEEVSVGKLLIPESVAKNINRGIIVAVDEGKLRNGDEVLFDNRQALPVTIEEKEYLIVHETQILSVFTKRQ